MLVLGFNLINSGLLLLLCPKVFVFHLYRFSIFPQTLPFAMDIPVEHVPKFELLMTELKNQISYGVYQSISRQLEAKANNIYKFVMEQPPGLPFDISFFGSVSSKFPLESDSTVVDMAAFIDPKVGASFNLTRIGEDFFPDPGDPKQYLLPPSPIPEPNNEDTQHPVDYQTAGPSNALPKELTKSQKKTKRIKCIRSGCDLYFESVEARRNHLVADHKAKLGNWPCDFPGCDKVLASRPNLNRHKDRFHIKQYPCTTGSCAEAFNKESDLVAHEKDYHEKKYCCTWPGCDYNAINQYQTIYHIRRFHFFGLEQDEDGHSLEHFIKTTFK